MVPDTRNFKSSEVRTEKSPNFKVRSHADTVLKKKIKSSITKKRSKEYQPCQHLYRKHHVRESTSGDVREQ